MMNKNQRIKNRNTAKALYWNKLNTTKCPNCGELGPHWISLPMSLEEIIETNQLSRGFWTCSIYYSEGGRRISPEAERALDERIALAKAIPVCPVPT